MLHTKKTLTITAQQISQVFKAQGPLQFGSILSSWQGILLMLVLILAAGSMLFAGYTFCRKIVVALAKKG